MRERIVALLSRATRPLSIEEIADSLRISIRTARRHIIELEREGIVKAEVFGRRKLYSLARRATLDEYMAPTAEPLTAVEAMAERARAMKRLYEDTRLLERMREIVHSTPPWELQRQLIDHLRDKARRLEGKRDEDSRHVCERYKKAAKRIEATRWVGRPIPIEPPPDDDVLITGSDASRDMIELMFYAGHIPLTIRAGVVAYVCIPLELRAEGARFRDPIRRPEFPYVAGGHYLKEFTYEPMDEEERRVINLILMNTAHFTEDKELIVALRPRVHFHEGRLIPPHPHYLDFKPARRMYQRKCFLAALELKRAAVDFKCELVGSVKDTHPETQVITHVVSMLLEELAGRDSMAEHVMVDEHAAASLLLGEGYTSWVVVTDLKSVYLAGEEGSARSVLGDDYETYVKYLEELSYATFYCTHRAGVARYDIFPHGMGDLVERRNRIASYADAIASPLTGRQYDVGRYRVAVPSVVSVADGEAKAWAKRVADIIAQYVRQRLLGGVR